jgi:DNA invertase Pin-like site-specific DNA recombinase
MRIGYARVSTPEQSCALQCDALEQSGCTKVFQEVASGAKAARPALIAGIRLVRDTSYPQSLTAMA